MGDDEESGPIYTYTGERAAGDVTAVTAGEAPKVLTQDVTLLGPRSGAGAAAFPNGDSYSGEYGDGLRSGLGSYTYAAPPPEEGEEAKPPVATYEGKWSKGEKSGVGTMTFASGAKYHGAFSAGKFSGAGAMYYANGDIYTGEWADGKKSGTGTYIYKETGAKLKGVFEGGLLKSGTFTDKYGNTYSGGFAADATSATYVPGGGFTLVSGAEKTVPKPTKDELIKLITSFDADGNGVIDASELRALLTRPGTGVSMGEEEAEVILMILTEMFDKNADGKMQIAEVATMLDSQFFGF